MIHSVKWMLDNIYAIPLAVLSAHKHHYLGCNSKQTKETMVIFNTLKRYISQFLHEGFNHRLKSDLLMIFIEFYIGISELNETDVPSNITTYVNTSTNCTVSFTTK
jgi:hypothetical protein